jgi:hypothetical protein
MSLEKITTTYVSNTLDAPIVKKQNVNYSGFQKLEESNFKGGTSIKYWM